MINFDRACPSLLLWFGWLWVELFVPWWYVGVGARVSLHYREPRFRLELTLAPLLSGTLDFGPPRTLVPPPGEHLP